MNLKGSQTEKNLLVAFAGESQARNRYTFFASAARNEGYEFISAINRGNIIGTQFHPEKSHKFGMKLVKNFVECM